MSGKICTGIPSPIYGDARPLPLLRNTYKVWSERGDGNADVYMYLHHDGQPSTSAPRSSVSDGGDRLRRPPTGANWSVPAERWLDESTTQRGEVDGMLTPCRPADTSRWSSRPRRRVGLAPQTTFDLQQTPTYSFLRAGQNDSDELRPSSVRHHVTKMATIDFRFRFFAACLLSAIVIEMSTAEKRIESVDEWSLPDAQAFVGKLFRYRVTSNQPCAAHYKVNSTKLTCRHLSELFQNFYLSSSYIVCAILQI